MANGFVSQTATNGYVIGVDTNDGLTKATARLTVEAGIGITGVGDILTVNDGLYIDATNYLTMNKSITLEAENAYMVTMQNFNAQSRAMHISANNVIVGKIIIDGNGLASSGIVSWGAGVTGTHFRGTRFIGASGNGIGFPSSPADLLMDSGWLLDITEFSGVGIDLSPGIAGDFIFKDGTVKINNQTIGSTNTLMIRVNPSVTGCRLFTDNLTFDVTAGVGKGATVIDSAGCSEYELKNCHIQGTAPDRITGPKINNHASLLVNKLRIFDWTRTTTLTTGLAGYGCFIGSETAGTGDNSISDAKVFNNQFGDQDHGMLIGFSAGVQVFANSLDNVNIGFVPKGDTGSIISSNIVTRSLSQALYAKGSLNTEFRNNVHIMSTGFASDSLYAGEDNVALVDSAGIIYEGNTIYSDVAPARVVLVEALNTATFTGNNFFYTGGALGSVFNYQGTTYASLAAFETGVATATGNLELDPDWDANFKLNATSPLLGAGSAKWWANEPRPDSFNGEPIPDTQIDLSHIQTTFDPNHPVNL